MKSKENRIAAFIEAMPDSAVTEISSSSNLNITGGVLGQSKNDGNCKNYAYSSCSVSNEGSCVNFNGQCGGSRNANQCINYGRTDGSGDISKPLP